MGDSELNCEASGESSGLPGEESAQLISPPTVGTQNYPLQEERIQIIDDLKGDKIFAEDFARIFEVLKRGDHEALSDLLKSDTTTVCAIYRKGNTALHHAVALASYEGDSDAGIYKCINLLMNCKEMKLNIPNKKCYTAVELAVQQHNRTCLEHMLKHPSADRLYLENYPGDTESTVREIILETYPDLVQLLTDRLTESLDSSERNIKLLAALQEDKFNIFIETLDSNNPNPWYDEPYHSSLLEIACQKKKRENFVKLILDNGADPNIKNDVTGMPLLHTTARSGNFEVLEILLQRQNVDLCLRDNEERTILHWWAKVSERNQGDKESLENVFNYLLQWYSSQKACIDCKDISGMTPLCTAIVCENRDRVILLLGKGADVMECDHAGRILNSSNTSVLADILDYCLDSNDEPVNSENLRVTLRYRTLERMLFFAAILPHHKCIVRHAACSIFLSVTWKKSIKFIFTIQVIFYIMLLFCLTAYILHSESADRPCHKSVSNNSNGLFSFNDRHITCGMKDEKWYIFPLVLQCILVILLVCLFWGWINWLRLCRKTFICSVACWEQLLLIFVTLITCSGIVDSIKANRHFFTFATLLGWCEFVLLLRQSPYFSVHTEMFKEVSLSFFKYMARYIVLILAFAFTFYILFKEDEKENDVFRFTNPFISILKTIVMFTGEFYSPDLPFGRVPGTSHVIFLLFVFLIAIVLLNLLIGLAVGDTEKIRKEAQTLSLVARARMTSNTIGILREIRKKNLPFKNILLRYDLTEAMFVLYPNLPSQIEPSDIESLRRIITKKREINKKVKRMESAENWSWVAKELREMREILTKILNK